MNVVWSRHKDDKYRAKGDANALVNAGGKLWNTNWQIEASLFSVSRIICIISLQYVLERRNQKVFRPFDVYLSRGAQFLWLLAEQSQKICKTSVSHISRAAHT